MSSVSDRTAWMDQARCATEDPDLWFDGRSHADAARICASCPVAAQCREAGSSEYRGLWGGVQVTRTRVGNSPSIEYLGFPHGTDLGYNRHIREDTPPCGRCSIAHAYEQRDVVARNGRVRTPERIDAQKKRRQELRKQRAKSGIAFTGIRVESEKLA